GGTGAPPANLEVALAHVLQLGTYISVGLVAIGSALLLASGGSPVGGGPPFDLARLPADLVALQPAGFLWLGILGVLSTPALRVGRAVMGFARRDEQRMVVVSVLVLGVIAVGVFVGVTAH
ncbi:MAG: DUF1634 domain-containing protein, partial [Chloroflexota bacterium]